jgi:cell division transport system ATP-binding protein
MIRFENLSKIYNGNSIALKNVSFQVKLHEFVSVVGRSGAGKSTLLKLLIAEEEPTDGNIYFNGESILSMKPKELPFLRRQIGAVFQDFKLLPNKTAFENVAFAMEVAGKNEEEIRNDVPKVLDLVGLGDKANNFPRELSGGEKQRTAIARALVHRPSVIVADEPTGNLDPINTWDIIRLLLKINELGTTVILATHDKEIINALEKRVVSLDKGMVIRDENPGRYILS